MRTAVARSLAAGINARHPHPAPGPASPQAREVVANLREDGCSCVEAILPTEKRRAALAFLRSRNVVADGAEFSGAPAGLPPGTTVADYPVKTLLECDELLEAANHPLALEIARTYLGCTPTISTMCVRWSLPGGSERKIIQAFHRDCDDWKFLKLFIYLSDVDLEAGPHTYILGTHRTPGSLTARPYTDEEIERRYGKARFKSFVGPEGTSFFCDTYGIHKGTAPTRTPRLMFLVQYSILPVYAYEYAPVPIKTARSLDPYTNRLLIA